MIGTHAKHRAFFLATAACILLSATAGAAEKGECRTPRLADIGWTDVTATTALTAMLLKDLGYDPKISLLSVPITYQAMQQKRIDIFLGNWMPVEEAVSKPFFQDGSVENIGPNLSDAMATLATLAPTYDAGLKSFADIKNFAGKLNGKIYGIEAGSGANGHLEKMIASNEFGLGKFKLIESSEQGMLAEVARANASKTPVVFLGWEPHPMNLKFPVRYLSGGDPVFGPNNGGAVVNTNVRAGYGADCPNVYRLLKNLKFTLQMEDAVMADILDKHATPENAAKTWIAAHPETLVSWMNGVTTLDGKPGLPAVQASIKQ